MRTGLLALLLVTLAAPPAAAAVKVACVGEHTTHSAHQSFPNEYPAKLQALLGTGYEVKNFGFPRALVLRKAPNAYTKPYEVTTEFAASKAFLPDIVILGPFGKHDTQDANWKFKADFPADLRWLAEQYLALPSKPKVYIALPIPFPYGSPTGTVGTGILPPTRQVAMDLGLPVVDLWKTFLDKKDLFSDQTHLTAPGVQAHAAAVAGAVKGAPAGPGPGLPGDAGTRDAFSDADANRAVVDVRVDAPAPDVSGAMDVAPETKEPAPLPEPPAPQVMPPVMRAPDAGRAPAPPEPAPVEPTAGRAPARGGCTIATPDAGAGTAVWIAFALALGLLRGRSV